MTATFVFVAKSGREFMRYPKDGFRSITDGDRDGRELFRYRRSDKCNVFILDSFAEKDNLNGRFGDVELLCGFCRVIIENINSVLSPDSQDQLPQDVVVFTHWGGGDDRSICKGERDLQKTYQDNVENDLPGWKFYSLSSLRKDLFDVEGNITIGDDEELQKMLRKFELMYRNNRYAPLLALGIRLRSIADNQEAGIVQCPIQGIEEFQKELCELDKTWEVFLNREQKTSIRPDVAEKMIKDISCLLNLSGANNE